VWQCRYSGIEVPDELWSHADIGVGKFYADDQADRLPQETVALETFDAWTDAFVTHVSSKGALQGTLEAERATKSTTQ
jgi:hypothetical protein